MKSHILIVIYNKKQIRSFLETNTFNVIFEEYKDNANLLYTTNIAEYIKFKQSTYKPFKLNSKFMFKYGSLLYSSLLWRNRFKTMAHYRRAMATYSRKSQRKNNSYPMVNPDILMSEFYRYLVRLVSIKIIFNFAFTLRKKIMNFKLGKIINNTKIDLKEYICVFIPYSGLLSSEFDDLVNFFNSRGLYTIAIQDNWDNLSSKSFINSKPSYFCVWGEQSAGHLQYIHSLENTKIRITGSSRLLPYYSNSLIYKEFKKIPSNISKELKNKYVLFTGTGDGLDDMYILKVILKSLSENLNYKIVYRPHPFVRNLPNKHMLKKLTNFGLIIDSSKNSKSVFHHCGLVYHSELIITQLSTILVEGLLINKKVLIPAFIDRKTNFDYVDSINTWAHLIGIEAFPNIYISKKRSNFRFDLTQALESKVEKSSKSAQWIAAKLDTSQQLLKLVRQIEKDK